MDKGHSLKDLKNLLQSQTLVKSDDRRTTPEAPSTVKAVRSNEQAAQLADEKESGSPLLTEASTLVDEDKLQLEITLLEQEEKISALEAKLLAAEQDLKISKSNLELSKSDLEQISTKLQDANKEILLATKKHQELREQRDNWRSEHNYIKDKIEAQARVAGNALSKQRHLEIKNAEYLRKIEKSDQKVLALQETIDELQARADFKTSFSIDNLAILDWLTSGADFHDLELDSPYISVIGDGPFKKSDFDVWLRKKRFKPVKAEDPRAPLLLLGRTASEFDIEGHLMEKIGEEIRVFSQELLVATLIAKLDPFAKPKSFQNKILKPFAEGHPGLSYLRALNLPWPSLDISENFEFIYTYDDAVTETPLHAVGYRVGVTAGLSVVRRHELLKDVFNGVYDEHSDWYVESDEYMSTWGQPKTRRRLCRMAYHIAAQIANKKRRKNHEQAVEDWRNDLDWMRKNLYQKSFKFSWPNIKI